MSLASNEAADYLPWGLAFTALGGLIGGLLGPGLVDNVLVQSVTDTSRPPAAEAQ